MIACLDFRTVPDQGSPINCRRRGVSNLKGLPEILDTLAPGRIVVDDDGETCRYVLPDGLSFPAEDISSGERLFLTLKGRMIVDDTTGVIVDGVEFGSDQVSFEMFDRAASEGQRQGVLPVSLRGPGFQMGVPSGRFVHKVLQHPSQDGRVHVR